MAYWTRCDVTVETKATQETKKKSAEPLARNLNNTGFNASRSKVAFGSKRTMRLITWDEVLQPSIALVKPLDSPAGLYFCDPDITSNVWNLVHLGFSFGPWWGPGRVPGDFSPQHDEVEAPESRTSGCKSCS